MVNEYTQEELEYIRENYHKVPAKDIAEHLNRSVASLYAKAQKLKVYRDIYYTKEDDDFIKANYLKMSDKELGKALGRTHLSIMWRRKDVLNLKKTSKQAVRKEGIFKKGHIPANAHKTGTIILRQDGNSKIYYIKVENKKQMVKLHHYVYEQAHGKIPKGYVIRFKDGNTLNCDLDNLRCMSRCEHLEVTRCEQSLIHKAINNNPQLKRLYQATKILEKKVKNE